MIDLECPTDALFTLERRIARRADELRHGTAHTRENDLACWRQAELEVCAEWELGAPSQPTAPHRG